MQISNIGIQNENCANILRTLQKQGISAIPLNGKRPSFALKWKQYQHRLPSTTILDTWSRQKVTSYGIICGRISGGIVVIDFDCPDLYQYFVKIFPDLAQTYTVQTRRGYHVYLQSRVPIPSRQFKNCDIKGEGGYVVGAQSKVDNHTYHATLNKPIAELTYKTYQEILEWLSPPPTKQETIHPIAKNQPSSILVKCYENRIHTMGRNNALFATACEARQHGMTVKQTIQLLAEHHATTEPVTQHKKETTAQRLREAIGTIQSAFKSKTRISNYEEGLPNHIREALLKQQSSSVVARLLDAVRLAKCDKTYMTLAQLLTIARHVHVSKKSLLRVLTGDLAKVNGKRIFKQIQYKDYIESYVSQGDKRTPNVKVGRMTQFIYKIPTVNDLCDILRVEAGVTDRLELKDLHSAATYRRALHREFIRRMSPMIRVEWYAKRLGVNRRTIFRYNIQLGVVATPMIQTEKLSVKHVGDLPTNDELAIQSFTPGMWLETPKGKRYPALQSIASELVKQDKCSVKLCRQLPTRYSLPDGVHGEDVELPDHLKSRSHLLTYSTVHEILPPDWATHKYDLGGYLAVYTGYEWTFRPPLRVIAYQLVKQYEDGLIYFIRPLNR